MAFTVTLVSAVDVAVTVTLGGVVSSIFLLTGVVESVPSVNLAYTVSPFDKLLTVPPLVISVQPVSAVSFF